VRFFTSLREITGRKEEVVEFSGKKKVTVRVVLDRLCRRFGEDFVGYVFDGETGDVRGFLQFLVNGHSVSSEVGLEAVLSDGDVLAIVPPVGGG
jgi:MoaD family protein